MPHMQRTSDDLLTRRFKLAPVVEMRIPVRSRVTDAGRCEEVERRKSEYEPQLQANR
jgi:hypothetical protein